MPHVDGVAALQRQRRILIIGSDDGLVRPLTVAITSHVAIDGCDQATAMDGAAQFLLDAGSYRAVITDEVFAAESERLLADLCANGPTPPPLIVLRDAAAPASPSGACSGWPTISVGTDPVTAEAIDCAIGTADTIMKTLQLSSLGASVSERIQSRTGGLTASVEEILGELATITRSDRAHLSIRSISTSGGANARSSVEPGVSVEFDSLRPAATPNETVLTSQNDIVLERHLATYVAVLQIQTSSAPLPPMTTAPLAALVDLLLCSIRISLESAHTDHPLPTRSRAIDRLELPELSSDVVDALYALNLALRHQPIVNRFGDVIGSDAYPAVRNSDGGLGPALTLDSLDSIDSNDRDTITADLTVPVGHWLLATAVQTLARLRSSGDVSANHRLHVHLLHRQLADHGTGDLIVDLLRGHRIDPSSLVIDVAEPTLIEHHDTIAAMSLLAEHGVGLCLDGFGGEGSNFTLLRTPLVRGVKLSKQVIANVSTDDRQASIVAGLVSLCDELSLEVTATGVDNQADLEWLRDFSTIGLQGDLIGPAQTEAELLGLTVHAAGRPGPLTDHPTVVALDQVSSE